MDSTIVAIDELGGFVLERFARPLMRVIKELGTCLVVLDTVVDVAVLDENARVPVNALAKKVLGQLCRNSGATILVTAHPSKASLESGAYYTPDRPRGMAPTAAGWCCRWTKMTRKSEP